MAKILLVEDDNNLREIYEARLQAEGYDIVTAMDGEEALAIAKTEMPDLIVSDVMMPRISGFEMLDILRNTDSLKNVKIIMLTALGQAEDKSRADSLGADRYLVKSQVTLEDIVTAAKELLGDETTTQTSAPSAATAQSLPDAVVATPQPITAAAPMPVVAEPTTAAATDVNMPAAPAPEPIAVPTYTVSAPPVSTPIAAPAQDDVQQITQPAAVDRQQVSEELGDEALSQVVQTQAQIDNAQTTAQTAPTAEPPASVAAPNAEDLALSNDNQSQIINNAITDLMNDADSNDNQVATPAQTPPKVIQPLAPTPTPAPVAAPAPTIINPPEPVETHAATEVTQPTIATVPVVQPPAPVQPMPVPAAPQQPAKTQTVDDDDGMTIGHKKIISPISTDGFTQPDLRDLLAKEGLGTLDSQTQNASDQNPYGNYGEPHQPGNVISPDNDPGKISL